MSKPEPRDVYNVFAEIVADGYVSSACDGYECSGCDAHDALLRLGELLGIVEGDPED